MKTLKPNHKTPLTKPKLTRNQEKLHHREAYKKKLKSLVASHPPKDHQQTKPLENNQTIENKPATGTKPEIRTRTTRDTRTLMEVIKHKQQQIEETKQQQSTRHKQKQTEPKQQNKTRKPKQENEKPNLPNITRYLTKNTNLIEARAAALQPIDKQVDVTKQPSTDATSASSIGHRRFDGTQPEHQTKQGGAAKGLQR